MNRATYPSFPRSLLQWAITLFLLVSSLAACLPAATDTPTAAAPDPTLTASPTPPPSTPTPAPTLPATPVVVTQEPTPEATRVVTFPNPFSLPEKTIEQATLPQVVLLATWKTGSDPALWQTPGRPWAAFSAKSPSYVAINETDAVMLYSLTRGETIRKLIKGSTGCIGGLSLSPDGKLMGIGGRTSCLWDMNEYAAIRLPLPEVGQPYQDKMLFAAQQRIIFNGVVYDANLYFIERNLAAQAVAPDGKTIVELTPPLLTFKNIEGIISSTVELSQFSDLLPASGALDFAFSPDGQKLYITLAGPSTLVVNVPKSAAQDFFMGIGFGKPLQDGTLVGFSPNIQQLTFLPQDLPPIPLPGYPRWVDVHPAGNLLMVGLDNGDIVFLGINN